MVPCAANGCNNSDNRSFYSTPYPNINPEKRNLAAQWLHNIGNGWSVKIFKVASHKRVCEDHFEAFCFLDDMQAKLQCWCSVDDRK